MLFKWSLSDRLPNRILRLSTLRGCAENACARRGAFYLMTICNGCRQAYVYFLRKVGGYPIYTELESTLDLW